MGSKTAAPQKGRNTTDSPGWFVIFGCPREEQCSGRGIRNDLSTCAVYAPGSCITVGLIHTHTHTHMQTHADTQPWSSCYQSVGVG